MFLGQQRFQAVGEGACADGAQAVLFGDVLEFDGYVSHISTKKIICPRIFTN